MYLLGAAAMGLFGFLYFTLLDTTVPGWIFLAIMLSLIPHDMMYGPQAALIAEFFTGRLRYSGRFTWLSSWLDNRRGTRAAHRYRAFCTVSLGLCHRVLHPDLWRRRLSVCSAAEGLHE